MVVGVAVSIALHEVGHLVPAKRFGVKVTQYMVGFGRTVWSRRHGETEYGVKAIPLGGYVKLGGDESNAPLEGQGASDIPPEEQFNLRPRWQRILVAVAGPVMNILTALAIPFAGAKLKSFP